MTTFSCPHCGANFIPSSEVMPVIREFILENWPGLSFDILNMGYGFLRVRFPDQEYSKSFVSLADELIYEEDHIRSSIGFTETNIMGKLVLISPVCPGCC
jgi:hypothetical protein